MRSVVPVICILSACASPRALAPPPVEAKVETTKPAPNRFIGLDVIGARKEPVDQIIAMLDPPPVGTVYPDGRNPLPQQFGKAREQIAKRFPFAQCRFNFAGYPDNTFAVTVDWVDKGDEWRMHFDPAPTGHVPDPDGLVAAWVDYLAKLMALREKGEMSWLNPHAEQDRFGFGVCHSALFCWGGFDHPQLAPLEQRFIDGVPRDFAELVQVLRDDSDAEKRSSAAMLLAYGSREQVVKALIPFLRDPDQGVRNQVMQLLGGAQAGADHVIVPLDPVLDALWFPQLTDRNKAGWALARITELEHGAHAKHIAQKAGEMLVEMAAAHQPTDSGPAQRVLKAISGEDHGSDSVAWRAWLDRVEK